MSRSEMMPRGRAQILSAGPGECVEMGPDAAAVDCAAAPEGPRRESCRSVPGFQNRWSVDHAVPAAVAQPSDGACRRAAVGRGVELLQSFREGAAGGLGERESHVLHGFGCAERASQSVAGEYDGGDRRSRLEQREYRGCFNPARRQPERGRERNQCYGRSERRHHAGGHSTRRNRQTGRGGL